MKEVLVKVDENSLTGDLTGDLSVVLKGDLTGDLSVVLKGDLIGDLKGLKVVLIGLLRGDGDLTGLLVTPLRGEPRPTDLSGESILRGEAVLLKGDSYFP